MAKPAAPGAQLRIPRRWGAGGQPRWAGGKQCGHGGMRRAGPVLGRAACPARAHALGVWDPPNPGTPRSRPRELLAGVGGPCSAARTRVWIYCRQQVERRGERALLGNRLRSGTRCSRTAPG